MRSSVSSNEIASARISCSDRSLKFFAKRRPPVTNQRCEYHFFGTPELGEAVGVVAARRTDVPVVRESEGLTITLSDSVTPLRISEEARPRCRIALRAEARIDSCNRRHAR